MKTGERIHFLRRRHGWSQREVADMASLNANSLARMERSDIVDPGGQVLARLARTLKTSTDYLLGLTDDPTPHWTRARMSHVDHDEHLRQHDEQLKHLVALNVQMVDAIARIDVTLERLTTNLEVVTALLRRSRAGDARSSA